MDSKTVLQMQLTGSFNLVGELTESASPEEWLSRPFRGANLVGFTRWHCARSIDWAVQRVVRGVQEIAERHEWSDRMPREALAGAGIPLELADSVAHRVSSQTLAEYLQAVQQEVIGWLSGASTEELETPIDVRARQQDRPEYLAPSVWAEVASLDGLPAWQILARPSVSHIRVHYGEVQSQLQLLRV